MTITYTWKTKHINTDFRGYSDTIYVELEGDNGTKKILCPSTSVLGSDLVKPTSQWTPEELDAFCESIRPVLEQQLQAMLEEEQT
jgi:hypothetical protein